ncbi:hypothetical protein [Streptomyces adustus]|uniref:hypothetical protein n=1 Tax=Streptomyces adustus TaxID=1609272 RepID=UPI00371CB578
MNFQGRLLCTVPDSGSLRLRLNAEGPWQATVMPLAAARRLTQEWLEGRGPEVLLHTTGPADFHIRYRGDDNLIAHTYELGEHTAPTALPQRVGLINEIGARRETHPLIEGPVIVCLEMADGPWRARLKEIQPRTAPEPAHPEAAQHFHAPSKDSGPHKSSRWGRRGRG